MKGVRLGLTGGDGGLIKGESSLGDVTGIGVEAAILLKAVGVWLLDAELAIVSSSTVRLFFFLRLKPVLLGLVGVDAVEDEEDFTVTLLLSLSTVFSTTEDIRCLTRLVVCVTLGSSPCGSAA